MAHKDTEAIYRVKPLLGLRIAMLEADLKQVELGAAVGLHASTISRIVNGWWVPPVEVQEAIRNALGPHGRHVKFGARCTVRRQRVNERGAARAAG
jgi:hypothetical protein